MVLKSKSKRVSKIDWKNWKCLDNNNKKLACMVRCGQRMIMRAVIRPGGELWRKGKGRPSREKLAQWNKWKRSECVSQAVRDLPFHRKNKDTPQQPIGNTGTPLALSIWDRKSRPVIDAPGLGSECLVSIWTASAEPARPVGWCGYEASFRGGLLGRYHHSALTSSREKTRAPQNLRPIYSNPCCSHWRFVSSKVQSKQVCTCTCAFQEDRAVLNNLFILLQLTYSLF